MPDPKGCSAVLAKGLLVHVWRCSQRVEINFHLWLALIEVLRF